MANIQRKYNSNNGLTNFCCGFLSLHDRKSLRNNDLCKISTTPKTLQINLFYTE